MRFSQPARWTLRILAWLGLVVSYLPLAVIVALSFNTARSLSWPPQGFTTSWWSETLRIEGPRQAFATSVKVALLATLVALVLGSLLAFALQRFRFFGRGAVSFLVVLPIALPGIVTAVALRNSMLRVGFPLGFSSVVIAHATFCVVIAYNNVIARLRRLSPNLQEASADLGADGWQTFRYVTFPLIRSALLAGGLLAFALSFDEIVVTTFTAGAGVETLPQWIFSNISRPNRVPNVAVASTIVMVLSIPAAWLAQRLSEGETPGGAAAMP